MKKLKTKSILACAVLASVLAGGMVPVQAANVNALVGPKDFGTLIGQNITFGQQRGYVENQTVTYPAGTPTWQIVAGDNGSITLLANQPWGYNRFSDTAGWMVKYVAIQQCFYQEALKYLNEDVSNFFSAEELRLLQNQTSVEGSHEYSGYAYPYDIKYGEAKYFGIFALPTTGQVNALGAEKRKREFPYWLIDGYNIKPDGEDLRRYVYYNRPFYYDVNTVQTDGSIAQQPGQDAEHIYPTINITPLFAYYEDKVQSDTFSSQKVWEPSTVSLTFKDTDREKNVNITKLSVAQEGITFDANGLATGEGQGIGGLLEDANGNYLAYACLADSINADGAVKDVKIKFNDTAIAGSKTIHLFNEWIGDRYDLAGNFIDVGVEMNSNKISELTYLPNVQELILGDGVKLPLSGDRNFKKLTVGSGEFTYTAVNIQGARTGSFCYTECQAVKVTEALDWANVLQAEGEIILKGSFSVEDGTLTLVRPTNTDYYWKRGITGWNDITYNGQVGQSATLKANGKMHGLVVNGGTFTSEKDLTLEDYLRVNNGAVVKLVGDVTAKNVNLNGTLNIATANKTIMVSNALNATGDAQIIGVNSSDKVAVGGNLMADGGLTLENVTLEAPNVQVAGGIRGGNNVSITVKDLQVKNMISADNVLVDNLQFVCAPSNAGVLGIDNLTVKKFWDVADKNSQTGTIRNLNFGKDGKAAYYRFDLAVDYFTVSGKAIGKVRPITQCFSGLENKTSYDVFTGSGDFSGLIMQDTRVTDMASKKTYILTQDINDRGTLNVKTAKHNTAANFADVEKFAFGNYWQEDTNGDGKVNTADAKLPVVWSFVKQDNGQSVFVSEKILAETGGRVDVNEMYKITNFLKQDGAFVKELFTTNELALLNVVNGDALGLPSLDDVKDGGNYGWNVDGRKAQTTSYAGDNARYYAIGSTHIDQVTDRTGNVNDWVDSRNGDINIKYNLRNKFADGAHYGIRPTITFDTSSVLVATNAEGGKGSVAEGQLTRLKDVDNASTLELTIDDAYLAAQNGTARKTGDVRVGVNKLEIGKDSIKTDYFTTYKDNNSYLSLFIGDAALPQDMFGYGKLAQVTKTGNGDLTLNLNDFTAKFADECVSGLALRFVNEYGSGSSWVGDFYDYGKMYLKDGKVTLDLPVHNLPRYDLSVAKGNKLIIRGTGKEDIISGDNHYLQIKGEGTVAFDNVVFSNKNLSESMDVEVNNATLRVEVNDRYENGAIVLKTANIVSKLNSVKGMEGTDGKLFLDITVMPLGFNETEWAFGTSKTLRCLDAKSNNVAFNFDERYVIVGSKDMYEFAAGRRNGEVEITRKKIGDKDTDGVYDPFCFGWFGWFKSQGIDNVNFGEDFILSGPDGERIFGQGTMKNFTVNGNGHKLMGDGMANGLKIYSGSTFTLKDMTEISGFKDFAFRNGGILNIEGETLLRSNILNHEETQSPVLTAASVLKATSRMQTVIGTTDIDGTLIVDTPIIIENDLKFENNSALKVFGSALNEGAAISGVNSLIVGDNVALQLDPAGLKNFNGEYPVIGGNVDLTQMGKFVLTGENLNTVFKAHLMEGGTLSMDGYVPDMANFGENLGVSRGAYTVAGLMGTAVQRHLKGRNTANSSSTLMADGSPLERSSVWATYIHNKDKVDGLGLGFGAEAKYDAQYNGTIVGYDFNQNSGVALAYVDGNTSNGYGGHNDGKHYGVSVYSKKKLGKAILSGDISYIHGKNELRQDINWENVKADAKTNTYSAGLHIANPVKLGQGTITSFAGLRYMHINGKEYRNNLGVTYEGEKMNIFTAPFGLNYQVTMEDEKSGWTVTPSIEVGYAFNFGDRNNDMTVGYKTAKDKFGYDVTDKGYIFLQGGLNFTKKNLTMGVGYDFTKGSNSHNNKWNVNMNWSF